MPGIPQNGRLHLLFHAQNLPKWAAKPPILGFSGHEMKCIADHFDGFRAWIPERSDFFKGPKGPKGPLGPACICGGHYFARYGQQRSGKSHTLLGFPMDGKTKEGGLSKKKMEKPKDGRQKSNQNIGNTYQMEDNKNPKEAARSAATLGRRRRRRLAPILRLFQLFLGLSTFLGFPRHSR